MIPAYVQSFKKEQKLGFMISLFVNAFMGLVKTGIFVITYLWDMSASQNKYFVLFPTHFFTD